MTDPKRPDAEDSGTYYEVARAPVQLRAVAALVREVLALLPEESRAQAMRNAENGLADDPGALRVLAEGLHIEFRKGTQE